MGYNLDFSSFEKEFAKIVEDAIPAEASKGLFLAGSQLLIDAMMVVPKAPFDKGHLWGSTGVKGGAGYRKIKETTVDNFKAEITRDAITAYFGFNIAYAARWHEVSPDMDRRIKWTTPGSGRKYLETKLIRYANKYMAIVAAYIQKKSAKAPTQAGD